MLGIERYKGIIYEKTGRHSYRCLVCGKMGMTWRGLVIHVARKHMKLIEYLEGLGIPTPTMEEIVVENTSPGKNTIVTFKLDTETYTRLQQYASSRKLNVSEVVRLAVEKALEDPYVLSRVEDPYKPGIDHRVVTVKIPEHQLPVLIRLGDGNRSKAIRKAILALLEGKTTPKPGVEVLRIR